MGIKKARLAIKVRNKFSKIAQFSGAIVCLFVFVAAVHGAPQGDEITTGPGKLQAPDIQSTVVTRHSSSLSRWLSEVLKDEKELVDFTGIGTGLRFNYDKLSARIEFAALNEGETASNDQDRQYYFEINYKF